MKRSTISTRRHRFHVCRQEDVILDGATILLQRKALYEGWGDLTLSRGAYFAPNGNVVQENRNLFNATVRMRYRPDVLISSAAWLYEERRKSAPRWFKILSVAEERELFVFKVRIVERGDEVQPAVDMDTPAPTLEDVSPVAPSAPDWLKL